MDDRVVERARFVAISVPMHTALRIGLRAAVRVRELNPSAKICFFGLYALLNSEFLIGRYADYVLGGECEETLTGLVSALEAGKKAFAAHAPVGKGISLGEMTKLRFPVPSREGLAPLENYARFESEGGEELVGYVEATRGCKHLCAHCPIPPVYGGRFFVVPESVVLEDVRRLVSRGARHITFGDPDFLNGPGHSFRITEALHREHPDLSYDFTAKVEHLIKHADVLARFAETGCSFVVTAAESLSDLVLQRLKKGHSRRDVFSALSHVRRAGMALRPTWVPFTPWSTIRDYVDILEFVEREDLIGAVDLVQYAIRLLIPPGSLLLSDSLLRPHLRELIADGFSYRWVHPDPRMDRLYAEVLSLVEESTLAGKDPFVSFFDVKEAAFRAAGLSLSSSSVSEAPISRRKTPRLTEPWFC
jgi:radical SAM superfamily enzyme YgiQ (UPF0313 family)